MSRTSMLFPISEARSVRDAAIVTLRGGGDNTFLAALTDFIESEIINAHTTLETCKDDRELHCTQGKILAYRSVLAAINPHQSGFLGDS